MMNPVDSRYIGSSCEIRSFANELLGVGIISEIGEDYIVLNAKEEQLRLFNSFAKIKLNIFNAKAGLMVVICEVLTSAKTFLKVVDPLKIVDHERRSGFRVPVDFNAKISSSRQALESGDFELMQVVWVKDMSICGLRFHASRRYIRGQIVWLSLMFDAASAVTVKAQIIRAGHQVVDVINDEEMREYGVKLMFDREEDSDKLCSYIFKVQREQSQRVK